MKSVASEETAVEVYTRLRTFLAKGGFQLTNWTRNSEKVMQMTSPEERSGAQSKTFEAEPLVYSILGLQWNKKSESVKICRSIGKKVPAKVTQRNVLSHVSSVFHWGSSPQCGCGCSSKEFERNMGNRRMKSYCKKMR